MCLFGPFLISAQIISEDLEELTDIEWKIFNSTNEHEMVGLLLEKSKVYVEATNYKASLTTLDRINTFILDDSLEEQVIEARIHSLYFNGDYERAKSNFLEAELLGMQPNDDLKLVAILNYIALKDLTRAKVYYQELNPDKDISEVFAAKKFRDPKKAFGMSIALPGSGQMYAGKVVKGLTSIGIQTILFTGGIKGLQRKYFFTEALPSIALFQGFYFGGAEYARELTEKRNDEIVKKLSVQVLDSF